MPSKTPNMPSKTPRIAFAGRLLYVADKLAALLTISLRAKAIFTNFGPPQKTALLTLLEERIAANFSI